MARCKKVTDTSVRSLHHNILHQHQPQRRAQYSVVVYCKGAEESKKDILGKIEEEKRVNKQ